MKLLQYLISLILVVCTVGSNPFGNENTFAKFTASSVYKDALRDIGSNTFGFDRSGLHYNMGASTLSFNPLSHDIKFSNDVLYASGDVGAKAIEVGKNGNGPYVWASPGAFGGGWKLTF